MKAKRHTVSFAAGPALAQDARIAALEARVAKLEEKTQLGFGVGGAGTFGGGPVESDGITIGISETIDDWTFGIAYGLRENNVGAATDTERLQTVHLTANYQIRDNTTFGLEYIVGERDLFNGSSVSADRVQAAVQFNF